MNDFTIQFDNNSNIPLYRQLYDYLLKEIRAGNLKENEKLPSRRALCGHLKINKNTGCVFYPSPSPRDAHDTRMGDLC